MPVTVVACGFVEVAERVCDADMVQRFLVGELVIDIGRPGATEGLAVKIKSPGGRGRFLFQREDFEEVGQQFRSAQGKETAKAMRLRVFVLGIQPGLAEPGEFHRTMRRCKHQMPVGIQRQTVGRAFPIQDAHGLGHIFESRQ